jgi:hypothetical protein
VKEKPVTSPEKETPIEPKKRRFPILLLLLLLLFLAFCVFAVIMRLRDPTITLWKMLRFPNISLIPKKSVLKTRPPKLIEAQKVTKQILAKDGGEVELTSTNGYTYRITVAPGVLKQDVTIGLTPLEEAPFTYPEDPANPEPAEGPPDPGVDITVDPPNPPQPPNPPNPPEPPDEPPVDPTDGNTGVEIYVFPPGWGRRTIETGSDPAQQAQDLVASLGLGNLSNLISPAPKEPEKPAPSGTTEPPKVIILIPRRGQTRIRKPSPVWANNGHNTPPEGSGTSVPEGGGTATPDDTSGKKGQDQADQAKENSGGRCTAEFINAVTAAYGNAGTEGQQAAFNRYGTLLEECEKEIIGYLKRLCEMDKRLLRRADFEKARKLLALTRAGDEKFSEVAKLEKSCIGFYSLSNSGTQPGSSAGVSMSGSLSSQVCGYFDDLWKGNTTYILTAEDGGSHTYEGTTAFHLPPRGGKFVVQDITGEHAVNIGGSGINVALPELGFSGIFDSRYTVELTLYPKIIRKTEIPASSKECTELQLDVPIAPKPNSPEDIPLAPLAPIESGQVPQTKTE